jgi:hypothetical protein
VDRGKALESGGKGSTGICGTRGRGDERGASEGNESGEFGGESEARGGPAEDRDPANESASEKSAQKALAKAALNRNLACLAPFQSSNAAHFTGGVLSTNTSQTGSQHRHQS